MRASRRIIALLMLLGWLLATGHIALHHGGVADGSLRHAVLSGADAHCDDESESGQHEHHDFAAAGVGHWTKSAGQKALSPVWRPLGDWLDERLAAQTRSRTEPRWHPAGEHRLADGRACGWLFSVQTAQPVRGPSLV